MPIHADICRYMPIYADICRSMPIFADLCRYMSIYAVVFRSMPIYADLCRSIWQDPVHASVLDSSYLSTPVQVGLCRSKPVQTGPNRFEPVPNGPNRLILSSIWLFINTNVYNKQTFLCNSWKNIWRIYFYIFPVTTCESGICEAGSFLRVPTAAGYLASSLTLSRGCGSVTCPWVLTPQPGQRFNLTFYNFPAAPTDLTPGQPMARGRYCQRLAVIVDKFTQVPKDVTICNEHPSPTRTIQFITTESVPVEIKIFGPISIENPTFFIVRYEGKSTPPDHVTRCLHFVVLKINRQITWHDVYISLC